MQTGWYLKYVIIIGSIHYNSILCATTAHINVDECGAPGRLSGCALVPIETKDGKLTPELIQPHLHNFGFCHHSQPKAVYISQASELGTVYTINEVKAIADLLHSYGMFLHMKVLFQQLLQWLFWQSKE